jgi:hypothetical protein
MRISFSLRAALLIVAGAAVLIYFERSLWKWIRYTIGADPGPLKGHDLTETVYYWGFANGAAIVLGVIVAVPIWLLARAVKMRATPATK